MKTSSRVSVSLEPERLQAIRRLCHTERTASIEHSTQAFLITVIHVVKLFNSPDRAGLTVPMLWLFTPLSQRVPPGGCRLTIVSQRLQSLVCESFQEVPGLQLDKVSRVFRLSTEPCLALRNYSNHLKSSNVCSDLDFFNTVQKPSNSIATKLAISPTFYGSA